MQNQNKNYLFLGENQKLRKKLALSLLAALIGVFLLPGAVFAITITPENIIDLTNELRIDNKLDALTANQLLAKAAYEKGRDILESQEFAHNLDGRKFSTWVKEAGYTYAFTGENLAIDFITAQGVIAAWQDSPTHNKNLLNPNYTEIGVSVLEGEYKGKNAILVVQIFGTPARVNIGANTIGADTNNESWQIADNSGTVDKSLTVVDEMNAEVLMGNVISGNIGYQNDRLPADQALANELSRLKQKVGGIGIERTFIVSGLKMDLFEPSANSLMSLAVFVFLIYLLFLYTYYFTKVSDLSRQLESNQKNKNQ